MNTNRFPTALLRARLLDAIVTTTCVVARGRRQPRRGPIPEAHMRVLIALLILIQESMDLHRRHLADDSHLIRNYDLLELLPPRKSGTKIDGEWRETGAAVDGDALIRSLDWLTA